MIWNEEIYILDGINSTLDTTKEKISEFEDIVIDTMKNEQ